MELYYIIIGLIMGSFITMYSYRLPRGKNLFLSSSCINCKHALSWRDLVPVVSYIILLGKCRYCKKKISFRYLLIEIFVTFSYVYALTYHDYINLVLLSILIVIIIVDIEHYIIPDFLQALLLMLGLYLMYKRGDEYINTLSLVVLLLLIGYGIRSLGSKFLKKEALGFGDVKFFAVSGFFLKADQIGVFLIIAGVIGVVMGILWKLIFKKDRFPFGPALSVALYLCFTLKY